MNSFLSIDCPDNCSECENSNECKVCDSGYNLVGTTCYVQCGTGYYNSDANTCSGKDFLLEQDFTFSSPSRMSCRMHSLFWPNNMYSVYRFLLPQFWGLQYLILSRNSPLNLPSLGKATAEADVAEKSKLVSSAATQLANLCKYMWKDSHQYSLSWCRLFNQTSRSFQHLDH